MATGEVTHLMKSFHYLHNIIENFQRLWFWKLFLSDHIKLQIY